MTELVNLKDYLTTHICDFEDDYVNLTFSRDEFNKFIKIISIIDNLIVQCIIERDFKNRGQ